MRPAPIQGGGLRGPGTVPEGFGGEVEVEAPAGTDEVLVTDPATGAAVTAPVGADGVARFPLPPGSRGGTVLIVIDRRRPWLSTLIEIVGAD